VSIHRGTCSGNATGNANVMAVPWMHAQTSGLCEGVLHLHSSSSSSEGADLGPVVHQVNSGNSQSYAVSRQNQRFNYLVNSPS